MKIGDGSITQKFVIKNYDRDLGGNDVELDITNQGFTMVDNVIATPRCGGYVTINGVLARATPIITWRFSNDIYHIYFHIMYILTDGTIYEPSAQDKILWSITVIGR